MYIVSNAITTILSLKVILAQTIFILYTGFLIDIQSELWNWFSIMTNLLSKLFSYPAPIYFDFNCHFKRLHPYYYKEIKGLKYFEFLPLLSYAIWILIRSNCKSKITKWVSAEYTNRILKDGVFSSS